MKTRMKRASSMTAAALFAAAVAVMPAWAAAQKYEPAHSSCRVVVEGTSTMHDWETEGHEMRGELILTEENVALLSARLPTPSQSLSPPARVEIPVESLKSGKTTMDKNLQSALRANEYPVITYKLTSAVLQPGPGGTLALAAQGTLTVAGKTREASLPMDLKQLPDGSLEVTGKTALKMTDFGVAPPKLMMGMLKVGDAIRVRWTCVFAPAVEEKTK